MRMNNFTFTADWLEESAHPELLSARAAALLLRRAHARLPRGRAAHVPEVRGRHKRDIGQARPVTEPLGQPHWGGGREQWTFKCRLMKIIPHTPVERRMLRTQKDFMFSSPLASQNLTGLKYLGTGRIILMVMDVIGSCYWSRNNYASQTSKNNPGPIFIFSVLISGHDKDNYSRFVIAISFSKVFTAMNPKFYMQKTRWWPPKYFMIHLFKVESRDNWNSFKVVLWWNTSKKSE